MKKIYFLFLGLFVYAATMGQTFLEEDFNGVFPPTGWTREGVPNQWSKSQTNNAGGQAAEAKFTYINQNTTSRLISPVIDLTGQTSLSLSFKYFYDWYANGPTIGVAYRFGTGEWQVAGSETPTTNQGPQTLILGLTDVGHSDFQFCFFITGNLYNVDYWYIDDVKLFIPFDLDAGLTSVEVPKYVAVNAPFTLKGVVTNEGSSPLTSFDVNYSVNGGALQSYAVSGINLPMGATYDFTHPVPIVFETTGSYTIETSITNVNAGTDQNTANNVIASQVGVVTFIPTKKVLAEEATGTWCGWCVRGICFMDYMAETYPDTWIGVAVHNGDPMVYAPYDAAIGSIIPGFQGYPNVTTDRTAGDSDPSDLETAYNRRINAISPGTIDIVDFSWNPDTRDVTFILQSEFVADVLSELRFGVIVTEDSLWGTTSQWGQANYYAGGSNGPMCGFESLPGTVPAAQMHYDHVARTILDSPYGTPSSITGPVTAGSLHSYSYSLNIPETWNYDKLHFIGFLLDYDTKEILNANNVISNYVGVSALEQDMELKLYPNPASSNAKLSFKLNQTTQLRIEMVDIFGKVVQVNHESLMQAGQHSLWIETQGLRTGTYLLKITAGEKQLIKKLMIQ